MSFYEDFQKVRKKIIEEYTSKEMYDWAYDITSKKYENTLSKEGPKNSEIIIFLVNDFDTFFEENFVKKEKKKIVPVKAPQKKRIINCAISADQESKKVTGAASGAIIGAVALGPIGAAVGGIAGATIGKKLKSRAKKVNKILEKCINMYFDSFEENNQNTTFENVDLSILLNYDPLEDGEIESPELNLINNIEESTPKKRK